MGLTIIANETTSIENEYFIIIVTPRPVGARGDANVVERGAVTGEERGDAVAQRAEIPTSALPPLPPGGRPTCFCVRDPQRFCHFVRPLVATPLPRQPYDAYEFYHFLTKFAQFDFCVPRDPSAITPLSARNFFQINISPTAAPGRENPKVNVVFCTFSKKNVKKIFNVKKTVF